MIITVDFSTTIDMLANQQPSAFTKTPTMDAAITDLEGPFAGLKNIKIN